MRVSPKYDAFLDAVADVEFLEGTTQAGKTTVGVYKFMLNVAESPKRQHIIAGLDTGTVEKNIIDKESGILDEFGSLVTYNGAGSSRASMPHIVFRPAKGVEKIIYILGYDDKRRWKKALGGQYGCLYIDEINIADMDFVREASMRCDYLIATLNPDDPSLPIYEEYINHSRPLPEWADKTPVEILKMLNKEPKPRWVHWFFSFEDNITLTREKYERTLNAVPEGTKLWKNKILGLRGRSEGLVFSNFSEKNLTTTEQVEMLEKNRHIEFKRFVMGVDTAYSVNSEDTIAMIFIGITTDGTCIVLEEKVYNNATMREPLAPSDTVAEMVSFGDLCRQRWGEFRMIFIDSADQATLTEARKYKVQSGSVYLFSPAYKKTKILDRINFQLGWIAKGKYLVCNHCKEHIKELNTYSWEDDMPEDRNDHTVNACQYAWLPFVTEIGAKDGFNG